MPCARVEYTGDSSDNSARWLLIANTQVLTSGSGINPGPKGSDSMKGFWWGRTWPSSTPLCIITGLCGGRHSYINNNCVCALSSSSKEKCSILNVYVTELALCLQNNTCHCQRKVCKLTRSLDELLRAAHDNPEPRTREKLRWMFLLPESPFRSSKVGGAPAVPFKGTVPAASPALGGCLAQGGTHI